jgi:hypothetical protein
MKKIPTIFVRDMNDHRVRAEITPGCEWVFNGEGRPTRKRDGTAVMVDEERLYWRRYDAKKGIAPALFIPAQDPDPATGHWPGWVPIGDGPNDKHFRSATWPTEPGTYEFCGPKVNGNPEGVTEHTFFRHGSEPVDPGLTETVMLVIADKEISVVERPDVPYRELGFFLLKNPMEGIVWHHPDGRMAKIKRRDFSLAWPER